MIDRGDTKASDMPVTTPVSTMLAAGCGGSGDVGVMLGSLDDDSYSR